MHAEFGPDLNMVISVLQTALTGRLSRIIDRSRDLQTLHATTEGESHQRVVSELRIIERRMRVVGSSILFAVLSAIAVCVMISLLFLMGLTQFSAPWIAVAVFMLALLLLVACLLQFVHEIRLATYAIYVPEEYLELPEKAGRKR